MVFVEPSKSINTHSLWLDERSNRHFILQRHRAAETRLGSSLQLMRNVLGPATGADGYRIIIAATPYYQVASASEHQEIVQDWEWIEEHMMPLAEKMENRDFRIMVVKYFSDLAEGKHYHLPRIASQHADLDALDKHQEAEEKRKLDEEEISVLGPDNADEDDTIEDIDLEADDAAVDTNARKEKAALSIESTDEPVIEGDVSIKQGSSLDSKEPEEGRATQWPGLPFMPEQYTHPEIAFNWLRFMARGVEEDGWRYVTEEEGVTFCRKEMEGPGGKHEIYKGIVVVDAPAKNVFEMLAKAENWPKLDRTLSRVHILDRIDERNDILHLQIRRFFPSFASFAQAVNLSSKGVAETERDMVVFRSWGIHERDSYVLYMRSIEYDKLKPSEGVIRMETDGYGFLIEPMASMLPPAAVRSPLAQASGICNSCVVTFVSDIDWKGWLTPIMGEYVHFSKVMLLNEVRRSFAPDLAFVQRKATPAHDDDNIESGPSSFQAAMKGFSSFVEQKKKWMLEEMEKNRQSKSRTDRNDEEESNDEKESEISMLDKLKAMIDNARSERNSAENEDVNGDKPEPSLWAQWRQALNPKTSHSETSTSEKEMIDMHTNSSKTGWLDKVKGALTTEASPTDGAEDSTEPKKGWLDRMKEAINKDKDAAPEPAPASASVTDGVPLSTGTGWFSRVKESVASATKKSTTSSSEKGWLDRMKEAVNKDKDAASGAPGLDSDEHSPITVKFSTIDDGAQ